MVTCMKEVLRIKKRSWLREALFIFLSFDDQSGRKLLRFKCDAPNGPACCDAAATCACGTHTGNYQCLCPLGHFGRGTVGHCTRKKDC